MPGQVVAVTGASRGIGAAAGAQVALLSRDIAAISALADEVAGLALPCDVADWRSVEGALSRVAARYGRLDVLVNNAGIAPLLSIDKTDAATIEQVYMTNAVGPACAIAAAWPVFMRQHANADFSPIGHRIVNISTLGTADPFPGFFAYAASKASLNLMAQSCALEGKPFAVKAFAIAPGAVETSMLRAIFPETVLPACKCMSPQKVAEEILACVMGERDGLNGKTIYLRGD